ncbi:MAG: NAD(+) kinase, partial [Porticoccaceae bacterium]|nr:NAD(+) kinase [Porticoccaceae bacterium]
MAHFQRIGLFGNLDLPEVKDSLRKLETFLVSQGRDVIYERGTADIVDWSVEEILHTSEFAGAIDLGIVVGGDGSMLSASRKMASIGVPLLGINRGRLG